MNVWIVRIPETENGRTMGFVLLAEVIHGYMGKSIMKGFWKIMYNEALAGWNTDEKSTTAQMGLRRVEKLWMNF